MKLPNYLIWYILGAYSKKIITQQRFSEHQNKRSWEIEIERLKTNKLITDLKYSKL